MVNKLKLDKLQPIHIKSMYNNNKHKNLQVCHNSTDDNDINNHMNNINNNEIYTHINNNINYKDNIENKNEVNKNTAVSVEDTEDEDEDDDDEVINNNNNDLLIVLKTNTDTVLQTILDNINDIQLNYNINNNVDSTNINTNINNNSSTSIGTRGHIGRIIHAAVGEVTSHDIMIADAANAVLVTYGVMTLDKLHSKKRPQVIYYIYDYICIFCVTTYEL